MTEPEDPITLPNLTILNIVLFFVEKNPLTIISQIRFDAPMILVGLTALSDVKLT